jgi:maleate isomerase
VTAGGRPLVGLIIPSSNPTVERLTGQLSVPALFGIDLVVTRLAVRRVDAGEGSDAQFTAASLCAAGELLADTRPDLVVWAGTSGCWRGGAREDIELRALEVAAGAPATSSRRALLAALQSTPGPVAVLTPYIDDVHCAVVATLRAAGIAVAADRGLGEVDNLAFSRITADVLRPVLADLAGPAGRPVAVVCTNLLVVDVARAVVDSVVATLWHAAALAGARAGDYWETYRSVAADLDTGQLGRGLSAGGPPEPPMDVRGPR